MAWATVEVEAAAWYPSVLATGNVDRMAVDTIILPKTFLVCDVVPAGREQPSLPIQLSLLLTIPRQHMEWLLLPWAALQERGHLGLRLVALALDLSAAKDTEDLLAHTLCRRVWAHQQARILPWARDSVQEGPLTAEQLKLHSRPRATGRLHHLEQ